MERRESLDKTRCLVREERDLLQQLRIALASEFLLRTVPYSEELHTSGNQSTRQQCSVHIAVLGVLFIRTWCRRCLRHSLACTATEWDFLIFLPA